MKALLSSTLVLIFFFCTTNSIFAQTPPSFKVLQSDFLLQTSAGKNLDEVVGIENLTSSKQTITTTFTGYNLPAGNLVNLTFLQKHTLDFANLPASSATIEAYATGQISIGFHPPDTYPSGDYYGTLILTNGTETQVVKFTVRILGELKENLEIKEIKHSGNDFVVTIANTGTIAESASVNLNINQAFGPDILLTTSKTPIRAGEIVEMKLAGKNLLPGFYQSQITLKYSSKSIVQTKLFSFWVSSEIFIVSLITLLLSFAIYFIFRGKRS